MNVKSNIFYPFFEEAKINLMQQPSICLKKIWFDDATIELEISTNDGNSIFTNTVYTENEGISDLISALGIFREQIYGGVFDINFGVFGPEYANGAFQARLHFNNLSRLYITVKAQSEFRDFGIKNVASEAVLYLISEPILLDNFIGELKSLHSGKSDEAKFEALKAPVS